MREPPGPCGAGRLRVVRCPDRSLAAAWPVLLGRAAVCAGGRRPAREIATRELRSEWSISKPGQALPPPADTAAGPSGALHTSGAAPPPPTGTAAVPSGVLHTSGAGCADDWLGVSSRSPARPCRRVASFVGPGRCVCRWAAARPLAVRAASCARRVVSKPGQALPPPTGTAARPRRPRCGLQSVGVSV